MRRGSLSAGQSPGPGLRKGPCSSALKPPVWAGKGSREHWCRGSISCRASLGCDTAPQVPLLIVMMMMMIKLPVTRLGQNYIYPKRFAAQSWHPTGSAWQAPLSLLPSSSALCTWPQLTSPFPVAPASAPCVGSRWRAVWAVGITVLGGGCCKSGEPALGCKLLRVKGSLCGCPGV